MQTENKPYSLSDIQRVPASCADSAYFIVRVRTNGEFVFCEACDNEHTARKRCAEWARKDQKREYLIFSAK